MSIFGEFLILLLAILILILYRLHKRREYWREQNVEFVNIWKVMGSSKTDTWGCIIRNLYLEMREKRQPFAALELPFVSMVILQDQQIIKDIMTTQFLNFPDRGLYVNSCDILGRNLTRVDYGEWKPLRQNLTPCFLPSKIKFMFPTVLELSNRLVDVMTERCTMDPKSNFEINDLCARFTTDVMGQVVFGLECNSLRDPNTEFRINIDKIFAQLKSPWKDLIGIKYPKILEFFNVVTFDKESNDYFIGIVKESLEYREKNNIKRQDFMDILINLRKENKEHSDMDLTLEALVGQVIALLVGGFETTSCTMTYALFELANHEEIQNKARKEIQEVFDSCNGKLTYEKMKDLKYLNQIMMETLRKYPILPNMPRICRKTSTFTTSTGSITIQPGTYVVLPFYGVHYNPDYYPEPEKFCPERFTEEEIAKRPPCSFLAFGDGPKSCIGEPFGKMQILLGLAMMLSKFRFTLWDKSQSKLSFDPDNMFVLFVKDGLHLNVEKL